MNEVKVFENTELGKVRVVTIDNEPWFVGKDVAEILGYKDTSDAIKKHVDIEDKLTRQFTDSGQGRRMYVINESGLYSLILSSHLESAKQFKRWVTSEVLPSIRKTGGYVSDDELFIENYLEFASEETREMFRHTLKTVREQNQRIKEMQPKADYFDALVDRNLLMNFRDTAKELKIKEKQFIKWLEDEGYVYRDASKKIKPYAKYTSDDKRYFEIKEWKNDFSQGNQTMITPRGREAFRLLICG